VAHGASDFQLWNTTLTNTNVDLYNACYLCREEERFEFNRHELEQRLHLGELLLELFTAKYHGSRDACTEQQPEHDRGSKVLALRAK
jgi:hypothetical protein